MKKFLRQLKTPEQELRRIQEYAVRIFKIASEKAPDVVLKTDGPDAGEIKVVLLTRLGMDLETGERDLFQESEFDLLNADRGP